MGPQEAIDFPSFSSSHFPSSFGGSAQPLVLGLEGRLPAATAARLEALGHKEYNVVGWSDGSIAAVLLAAKQKKAVGKLVI